MFDLTPELKASLKNCNQKLKEKYQNQSNLDSKQLRRLINEKVGSFLTLKKLSQEELEHLTSNRSIVGVDGSVNTVGKVYPHYITLLQALAKSTDRSKKGIIKHEVFSPLMTEDKDKILKKLAIANKQESSEEDRLYAQEAAGKIRSSLLVALEVAVAKESILKRNPKLIMMDGSLIRYQLQAEKEWEELVKLALARNVLIVGVIEEIGTHDLSSLLADEFPDKMKDMYDRELMFGLLDIGEMMEFNGSKEGLRKAFLRTSRDPGVIGIDILEEQRTEIELITRLVYSLTPQAGRGIPIWLDIVDEEVRISDKMIQFVIDNYLDSSLKQRLLHSKRLDRIY